MLFGMESAVTGSLSYTHLYLPFLYAYRNPIKSHDNLSSWVIVTCQRPISDLNYPTHYTRRTDEPAQLASAILATATNATAIARPAALQGTKASLPLSFSTLDSSVCQALLRGVQLNTSLHRNLQRGNADRLSTSRCCAPRLEAEVSGCQRTAFPSSYRTAPGNNFHERARGRQFSAIELEEISRHAGSRVLRTYEVIESFLSLSQYPWS